MAEFGITSVRIGIFQHALAHPEANSERFESIEAGLNLLIAAIILWNTRYLEQALVELERQGTNVSPVWSDGEQQSDGALRPPRRRESMLAA
jgi:Tn3 transposase DDE domain